MLHEYSIDRSIQNNQNQIQDILELNEKQNFSYTE